MERGYQHADERLHRAFVKLEGNSKEIMKQIDDAIETRNEKDVYWWIDCRNPKHNPYEVSFKVSKIKSKCSGCPALRTEKKEPEIKARDLPPGTWLPLSAIVDETVYHCRINDYISERKGMEKLLERK